MLPSIDLDWTTLTSFSAIDSTMILPSRRPCRSVVRLSTLLRRVPHLSLTLLLPLSGTSRCRQVRQSSIHRNVKVRSPSTSIESKRRFPRLHSDASSFILFGQLLRLPVPHHAELRYQQPAHSLHLYAEFREHNFLCLSTSTRAHVCLFQHNAIYREEEREMFPTAKHFGVGIIPWSPIARGALARGIGSEETVRAQTDKFVLQHFLSPSEFRFLTFDLN